MANPLSSIDADLLREVRLLVKEVGTAGLLIICFSLIASILVWRHGGTLIREGRGAFRDALKFLERKRETEAMLLREADSVIEKADSSSKRARKSGKRSGKEAQ